MKNILFCVAAFCIFSHAFAVERQLDSTLFVGKNGLQVVDGISAISFACNREWAVAFTNNGETATLYTKSGHWTLTGLSSEIAIAAISEGSTLVAAIATSVGVAADNVQSVTTKTLALATALAQNIGSPLFDTALSAAVASVNNILDSNGISASDFNDDILAAISLLGPSGSVIDASDTTVADVQENASKTIAVILNALASTGALSS